MRYGLFDDNGNYCGYDSDSYEFAQERAAALNERYQQGLEEGYYHVEEIDDDEEQDSWKVGIGKPNQQQNPCWSAGVAKNATKNIILR